MNLRILLLISVLLLSVGAAPASEMAGVAQLRHDGVFVSLPEPLEDGYSYCEYLRFYPSGTVITVSSDCGHEALTDIKEWFTAKNAGPKHTGVSRGKAIMKGNKVSFYAVSREGKVSYRGRIEGNRLHLKGYSYIGRNHFTTSYTFTPW